VAAVDFAQPFVFSTRNSFSASIYGERQSVPDAFIREAFGLSLAITRNIGPRTPLTLSYRPELSSLDAAEVLFSKYAFAFEMVSVLILAAMVASVVLARRLRSSGSEAGGAGPDEDSGEAGHV